MASQHMVNALRFLSADMVQNANSGHPGMPLGMADVAYVLFKNHLKFNPNDPKWMNRDRFVLSAGHGSALQYALLYLTGYEDCTIDDVKAFRRLRSKTAGHPEYGYLQGIETTTGPLGQGLANAVGMAIAGKILKKRSHGKIDFNVYVVVGDGCLMEGLSHEAASLAGHLQLDNLFVLFDDNGISIDGPVTLSNSENTNQRFEAYGFDIFQADGHNHDEIDQNLMAAAKSTKPKFIAFKTKIGFGAFQKEGKSSAHGSPLGDELIEKMRKANDWYHDPFFIPCYVLDEWRNLWKRNEAAYDDKLFNSLPDDLKAQIADRIDNVAMQSALSDYKQAAVSENKKQATRSLSQEVLTILNQHVPSLIGGSADLTPSNNTKTENIQALDFNNFDERYIHYGIREHAMAAVMNGLALTGGFLPYGGTFLVFSDYLKPALRLSALMKLREIYVFTHDSIALGEDGPTHQPIEHLASLRSIPNLNVFRPCDAVEVAETYEIALQSKDTPSAIVLTRQKLPTVRESYQENLTKFGGYEILCNDAHQFTIIASGSEVSLAISVAKNLHEKSIHARVVSMPCVELFKAQTKHQQNQVLGAKPCVFMEAGSSYGMADLANRSDLMIGIDSFGASGAGEDVMRHFGFTREAVIKKILAWLSF